MKISYLKLILISLVAFALIVFFLALNIDKRYSTEKIVGKSVEPFAITFLNNDDVFRKQDLINDIKKGLESVPILYTLVG